MWMPETARDGDHIPCVVDFGQQLSATSFLLHDFVRCAVTLFSNVWRGMDTKEIDTAYPPFQTLENNVPSIPKLRIWTGQYFCIPQLCADSMDGIRARQDCGSLQLPATA